MYTFMEEAVEEQQRNASIFTAQNARGIVNCGECSKPCMMYAKQKLSSCQDLQLTWALSETDYTCGSPLLPADHSLKSFIHARLAISCGDTVEAAFYSAALGRIDTCCHCASLETKYDADLCPKFKTVLPCCIVCLGSGKKYLCSRPYGSKK